MLEAGGSALDAVQAAVQSLEDCPLFNAGCGAVYTADETHEMDASVMDGSNLKAGAVAGVHGVRNPVALARAVMDHTNHVLLVGRVRCAWRRSRVCPWPTPPTSIPRSAWPSCSACVRKVQV